MGQDIASGSDVGANDLDEALRHAAVVGTAGVIAGFIVGGAGGRLLMRVAAIEAPDRVTGSVTENGNRVGDITVGGTIELLVFVGLFSGVFGAAAYVITEPWLSWAGRLRGLLFGILLIAAASGVALNPDNIDFGLVGSERLVVGMFLGLFVLYGVLLVELSLLLEPLIPKTAHSDEIHTHTPTTHGFGAHRTIVTGVGVGIAALVIVLAVFYEGVCDCEPRYVTEFFIAGTGAATVGLWLSRFEIQFARRWVSAIQFAGYLCLAGVAASGTVRAVHDIGTIV